MISLSLLKELLHYDPETGIFTRIKIGTPGNQRYLGKPAGNLGGKNYWYICVDGRTYKAHRLAWLYMTGEWPLEQIDHINGNRSDNRFSNLRQATNAQNQQNRGLQKSNTTGHKGIHWLPRKRPWRATITCNKRRVYLGCFYTKEEAVSAYIAAMKTHHGEFAKAYDL